MIALWIGLIFIFTTGQLFSMMLDGSSGVWATELSADVSDQAIIFPIESADGLPASDSRVYIGREEIAYDSILTSQSAFCNPAPCLFISLVGNGDRGLNGTTRTAHTAGTRVYSEILGQTNQLIGFNVIQGRDLDNELVPNFIEVPAQTVGALGGAVAKMILWDYSFLEGNGIYIKMTLLWPLSAGLVFALLMLVRGVRG